MGEEGHCVGTIILFLVQPFVCNDTTAISAMTSKFCAILIPSPLSVKLGVLGILREGVPRIEAIIHFCRELIPQNALTCYLVL
jgi:hypothetical protein